MSTKYYHAENSEKQFADVFVTLQYGRYYVAVCLGDENDSDEIESNPIDAYYPRVSFSVVAKQGFNELESYYHATDNHRELIAQVLEQMSGY